nr:MAG TPA: hypothetical protein [Caudoviricetes sp.]
MPFLGRRRPSARRSAATCTPCPAASRRRSARPAIRA